MQCIVLQRCNTMRGYMPDLDDFDDDEYFEEDIEDESDSIDKRDEFLDKKKKKKLKRSHTAEDLIREKIEKSITNGLNSGDLSLQIKAATLAAKLNLVGSKDKNIKLSELTNSIVDLFLGLSVETGYSVPEIIRRMGKTCFNCNKIKDLRSTDHPKVLE